jgi:hypothetical protein
MVVEAISFPVVARVSRAILSGSRCRRHTAATTRQLACALTGSSPIPGAGRRSKGLPDCRRRVWPDERHEQLPGDNRARSIGWREIRQWRSREYCDLALALSLPRRQLPSNVVRRLQSK